MTEIVFGSERDAAAKCIRALVSQFMAQCIDKWWRAKEVIDDALLLSSGG